MSSLRRGDPSARMRRGRPDDVAGLAAEVSARTGLTPDIEQREVKRWHIERKG